MTRYTVLDPKKTSLSLMMLGWSTSCVCECLREGWGEGVLRRAVTGKRKGVEREETDREKRRRRETWMGKEHRERETERRQRSFDHKRRVSRTFIMEISKCSFRR
jgi:hypothetical protein